ncbi:MAG TPA: Ohr family peroxiredoxin [Polyangiaceae bacterium]|jgi:Ohr subfamily peroxiredoxin
MKTLYTPISTVHGGRDGHVRSSDGVLDLDLRTPKEMGGSGGAGTNPEQLFAAGYAACFESAMRGVARKQKKPLADATVTGRVSFNVIDDGKYVLAGDSHENRRGAGLPAGACTRPQGPRPPGSRLTTTSARFAACRTGTLRQGGAPRRSRPRTAQCGRA